MVDNITRGDFRRTKRKRKRKIFFITLCIIALLTAAFMSPLFNVKKITVTGADKLTSESVITASGLKKGVHLTKVDFSEATKKLSKTPYISSAKVKYKFPATIAIEIEEKLPVVYYKFPDGYAGINSDGVFADFHSYKKSPLPVAKGIKLSSCNIGEKIKADEKLSTQLNVLVTVAQELSKAELADFIDTIDISEISNIVLVSNEGHTIKCGDANELAYKFAFLKNRLPYADRKDIIDISTTGKLSQEKNS